MTAVRDVVSALENRGGPVSGWIVGEPCVAPPENLRHALASAAAKADFGYAPPAGLGALRQLLASRHLEGGTPLHEENIVVTGGAKAGLLALLASLLDPGDELIHPSPCYPAYPAMARRIGARGVAVPEDHGSFEGWARAVERNISHRTRAVVLASPSNPTGATLDSKQSRELVDLCRDRGLRLICDEAYVDFCFGDQQESLPADFDPSRKTVIQVRSASKSWAVCGWRLGWVAADAETAARVTSSHSTLINPASAPVQEAMLSLDSVPREYLCNARAIIENRVDELCVLLRERGQTVRRPPGGFYLWLDLSDRAGKGGARGFCVDLAERCGVGLWPGDDFGGADHARIAVTSPRDEDWATAVEMLAGSL